MPWKITMPKRQNNKHTKLLMAIFCLWSSQVDANSNVCDQAAIRAAHSEGVPENVLLAITRVETGRRRRGILEPWPWTVNLEGAGFWFDNREAARSFALSKIDDGARSFDIGCFQINHKWHGREFHSINEMFDPDQNARYAARFLTRLRREFGSWSEAVGAYHSRTPRYANAYRSRFDVIYASLDVVDQTQPQVFLTPIAPLLPGFKREAAKTFGSLVQLEDRTNATQNLFAN